MANIFDYIDWRGDISFRESPFNDVDALILAQLSYLPFEGVLQRGFGSQMRLYDAAELFDPEKVSDKLKIITFKDDCELVRRLRGSTRFADILLDGYINETEPDKGEQFAALTFILPDGRKYISYRGTDDTIAGWKEDMNFSFMIETPSQLRAVKYLNDNFVGETEGLMLGGHSKGGNLAVYAAVYCEDEFRELIQKVYDFDGPGFRSEIADSQDYRRMIPNIISFIPETSFIGQLLTANVEHNIVKSSAFGIMQHIAYSWEVSRSALVLTNELSRAGSLINKTMKSWIDSLDDESRRMTVKAVFDVLEAPEAETFGELSRGKFRSYAAALGALRRLAPEQQKVLLHAFKRLAASGKDALFSELAKDL